MSAQKSLSRVSLVGGLLVILVGILHCAATPMVYRGLSTVVADKAPGLAYFFAVMGLYVVFAGWLMVLSAPGLAQGERWAWRVALSNGACNTLAGIGAVAVGFRNPLVWIWLCAALSVTALSVALRRRY